MNDAEEATLTYKQEAANFYGKDGVYRRIKQEMEERIARFNRRQQAMKGRAETHAKITQALYEDDFKEIHVIVKDRNGEDIIKYNINTLDDVREHLTKAKASFEDGIRGDIDYLNAMVEEQEAIGEHLTD